VIAWDLLRAQARGLRVQLVLRDKAGRRDGWVVRTEIDPARTGKKQSNSNSNLIVVLAQANGKGETEVAVNSVARVLFDDDVDDDG
jgi:hypothetical protein